MSYHKRIERLAKGRPCPACGNPDEAELVIVGLPPKPGSTTRHESKGYKGEPCSLCGAPPVHIKIKGLPDKPRNDEEFTL